MNFINRKLFLAIFLSFLILAGFGCQQKNKIEIKDLKVSNQLETYFVDVPTGNNSTCVWRYTDGSASVPYSYTTEANTKSEKHSIEIVGIFDNASVLCTDDWDNTYYAKFQSNPTPTDVQPLSSEQEKELNEIMSK